MPPLALAAAVLLVPPASPPPDTTPDPPPAGFPNLALPTLGGAQLWGDVRHRAGWRVQRHAWTGHHRLLDAANVRRAWGSRRDCERALGRAIDTRALPRPAGRVVILVHGMGRSASCWNGLAAELQAAGLSTVQFQYPSTRQSLRKSAEELAGVTATLLAEQDPGDPVTLHFVGHSAGGLVIRAWGEVADERVPVGRVALLGVPNAGAAMADRVRSVPGLAAAYAQVYGPAGPELSAVADQSLAALPVPRGPVLTVAGCRGTAGGWNPLVPGDDDGTVGVAETRLPGDTLHKARGVGHSFLMFDEEVRAAVVDFLKEPRP